LWQAYTVASDQFLHWFRLQEMKCNQLQNKSVSYVVTISIVM